MELNNIELLKQLIAIQGVASDESEIAAVIKSYVAEQAVHWKCQPTLIDGPLFQDTFMLVFGQPTTAIYAHMDTIGYSVGYHNDLIRVGGPRNIDGTQLVGKDSQGDVQAELIVIDEHDGHQSIQYVSNRPIDRGTLLSFRPNFRETEAYIQSPYLDNRLGVFTALEIAKNLENGVLVFSTYEEHGGNSVGNCARYLLDNYGITQALIADITWVTTGVVHDGGVAISMRDSMLPRRSYLNKIIGLANQTEIPFQLEVESAGGSDGSVLQKSDLPIDWCFIGAPEDNVHTPDEKVYKSDIVAMIDLYHHLMRML
jgi:putative aminopeptidase FrvX